jgi:hypothetical protein
VVHSDLAVLEARVDAALVDVPRERGHVGVEGVCMRRTRTGSAGRGRSSLSCRWCWARGPCCPRG